MDFGDIVQVAHLSFKCEFNINNFKESGIPDCEYFLGAGFSAYMSVLGIGERPENKDFVVIRILQNFDAPAMRYPMNYITPSLDCTCIFNILDVEGHKKFSRTFTFKSDLESPDMYEERYIERSTILNNASEYLQQDTLTVIVEGTVEEWIAYNSSKSLNWFPLHPGTFHVEHLEHDLKVYLPKYSVPTRCLLNHSPVFQDMWNFAVRETAEKFILLKNEELPAFLSMLLFLETQKLILHEVTIFDLYKIADKYDIPVLLERCRKYMEKYLPRKASAILEFATCYDDIELKRIVESYVETSHETRERNDNLEVGNEWVDDFVCDTRPVCSNLIHTEHDFKSHLNSLWEKFITEAIRDNDDYMPRSENREQLQQFDFYQ